MCDNIKTVKQVMDVSDVRKGGYMRKVVLSDGMTKLTLIEKGYQIKRYYEDIFTEELCDDVVTNTLVNEITNAKRLGYKIVSK